MATLELLEPEAADCPLETAAGEAPAELEQEAAEFIARQVLDRGATFFDG